MGLLDLIQSRVHGVSTWPPMEYRERWERVQDYRRRYDGSRADILQYSPRFNRNVKDADSFTPVPLAREMARFSAALLFSAAPKITSESEQDALDAILDVNQMEPFLQATAERIATEGRGALRVVWDEDYADEPLITFVPEDRVIWGEVHGRFVKGGVCFQEYVPDPNSPVVYRLFEEHTPGRIERALYKGQEHMLGNPVAMFSDVQRRDGSIERFYELQELAGLEAVEDTGVDKPTLIRWDNVPGGYSDFHGLDALLDELNEAESLLLDKGRKSTPVTFADASLADEQGNFDLRGIVISRQGNMARVMGEEPRNLTETVQPGLQAADHLAWIRHVREQIISNAGYSLASWAMDEGGSADSGKALKLRQSRTLITRAGKERMAVGAIEQALGTALAMKLGGKVADHLPEVKLGDGTPKDPLEDAQEANLLRGAEAASTLEIVRGLHPDWDEDTIEEEVARIEEARKPAAPTQPQIALEGFNPDGNFGGEDGRVDAAPASQDT